MSNVVKFHTRPSRMGFEEVEKYRNYLYERLDRLSEFVDSAEEIATEYIEELGVGHLGFSLYIDEENDIFSQFLDEEYTENPEIFLIAVEETEDERTIYRFTIGHDIDDDPDVYYILYHRVDMTGKKLYIYDFDKREWEFVEDITEEIELVENS